MLVDTDEICAAIKDVFEDTRVDPRARRRARRSPARRPTSSARGVRGKTLVAIACGANINFDRLRFVAERAEVGEHREAVLAVTIPERPGSFRKFCATLGGRNITEFNYRMADPVEAHVFVGVEVRGRDETARAPADAPRAHGLRTLDLSDNEMAKLHVRHLVGGHAPLARRTSCSTASSSPSGRAR